MDRLVKILFRGAIDEALIMLKEGTSDEEAIAWAAEALDRPDDEAELEVIFEFLPRTMGYLMDYDRVYIG